MSLDVDSKKEAWREHYMHLLIKHKMIFQMEKIKKKNSNNNKKNNKNEMNKFWKINVRTNPAK